MQGLDGLQIMSSTATSAGRARVTLSFVAGTDADVAQMQVQNKVQLALSATARVGAEPGRHGDQVRH
jgi:multidrug efflux pump subunit AcrB